MTPLKTREYIAAAVKSKGGYEYAARSWDIQAGNLKAVCEGRAKPGPRLCKTLGLTQTADGGYVVTRKSGDK